MPAAVTDWAMRRVQVVEEPDPPDERVLQYPCRLRRADVVGQRFLAAALAAGAHPGLPRQGHLELDGEPGHVAERSRQVAGACLADGGVAGVVASAGRDGARDAHMWLLRLASRLGRPQPHRCSVTGSPPVWAVRCG